MSASLPPAVDSTRSTSRIPTTSPPAAGTVATPGLLGEADRRREDLNRAFGRQLAGWLGSGARASGPTLESERLIPEVLAPLAASGPVLLVLLDGLTSNLLLKLLNVEGFPVLEVEEASATVVLDRELLLTQFELGT